MKLKLIFLLVMMPGTAVTTYAQDKDAVLSLQFDKGDSVNIVKVHVTSNDSAVKDVSVKLYVQRLFSQLQIGRAATTNDEGMASFVFPNDLPGQNGKLTVIAKIEDDENYRNSETKGEINWGVIIKADDDGTSDRTLWGSGDRAPIYLIIASKAILLTIWGTLIYVVIQIFRLKKYGKIGRAHV